MLVRLLSCFFALLFIASCDRKTLYQETQEIPDGGWNYRDSLNFTFPVTDTTELYDMYLIFSHADSFPHQNIYLKLYTRFPDGKRLSRVRSFDLFDAKGASNGDCSGGKCRVRSLLQDNAYFNRPGAYTITLEQFTRHDILPGVESLGLSIEKTGKKRGSR
jgi:gliding motility-associated lipoprotein GldH